MNTTTHVTVLGTGSMATVMALLLESKDIPVCMWGHDADEVASLIQTRENQAYLPGPKLPDRIKITSKADVAFKDCDLILSAVPTQFLRSVFTRLGDMIPPTVGIVSVSKGIEQENFLRPSQIIQDTLGDRWNGPIASLSGPTVADELARCLPATVCAASPDEAFAQLVQEIFTTHWFRVYTHTDLVGVELAGATKNCIALAAGILDGLKAGNNAKSALLARGLAELVRFGVAMGARPETFFGLTGVGDLATTCFSPTGRNRSCGEMLGKGMKLEEVLAEISGVVEGVPTVKGVVALACEKGVEMPICEQIAKVLFENVDPLEAIGVLMSRDPKPETVS